MMRINNLGSLYLVFFIIFRFYPGGVKSFVASLLRTLGFILVFLSYFMMVKYYQPIPKTLELSTISSGLIGSVATDRDNRRGLPFFRLENGSKYHSFSYINMEELKKHIGEKAKVWSYSRRDLFFFKKQIVIEVEVDGIRLFNNWEKVSSNLWKVDDIYPSAFLIILAFCDFLFLFFYLKKEYNPRKGNYHEFN